MSNGVRKLTPINTRGPSHGQCNICGEIGKLTEDHTPPKSCRGVRLSEMDSLLTRISRDPSDRARRKSRSRPCFRSLCARCNNVLLGSIYDPALADFCSSVRQAADTKLHLPNFFAIEIEPQKVMRSVLGHLAAQGVNRYGRADH
jgi:hypothetical protein